jgi:hypothetical protein
LHLLLDANLSPRRVAAQLRETGDDVLALAEHAAYEGLSGLSTHGRSATDV